MEFTIDKIAKEVAEKALNEITYEGKTLREWVEIIVKQDCISREEAKNLFLDGTEGYDCRGFTRMEIGEMLDDLPPVTPKTDVLDKIRVEIANIPKKYPMTMDYENGLKEALAIIDKYKVESEG